ncbi:hypothetical protein M9Y10_000056 [Tritrichomonas musculus]|uniref:Uncharacterized protein n=1 Tax=Tritrichomonas musculus TaxID=1915356 RepID=A0ABR2L461_9EUKA
MLARRRKIEFTLGVRKYRRDDYNALKRDNPKFTDDQIYKAIEEDKKSEVFISINSWLNQQNDLSEVWNDMRAAIEAKFEEFNISADKINKEHNSNLYDQETKLSIEQTNLVDEHDKLEIEIDNLIAQIFEEKDETIKADLQKQLNKANEDFEKNRKAITENAKEMERIREEIKLNEQKPTFIEEKEW